MAKFLLGTQTPGVQKSATIFPWESYLVNRLNQFRDVCIGLRVLLLDELATKETKRWLVFLVSCESKNVSLSQSVRVVLTFLKVLVAPPLKLVPASLLCWSIFTDGAMFWRCRAGIHHEIVEWSFFEPHIWIGGLSCSGCGESVEGKNDSLTYRLLFGSWFS